MSCEELLAEIEDLVEKCQSDSHTAPIEATLLMAKTVVYLAEAIKEESAKIVDAILETIPGPPRP